MAVVAALVVSVAAQQIPVQPSSETSPRPSFEVAVIRLNPDQGIWERSEMTPDSFHIEHVTVRSLIRKAWELQAISLVIGGPAWIDEQRYDIEARIPEAQYHAIEGLSKDQQEHEVNLMLQSLLSERFHLTVSHHSGEVKGLALMVAKGGPKLHVHGAPEPAQSGPSATEASSGPEMTFSSMDSPLSNLVSFLAKVFRLPVVDQTGLTGRYDIKNIVIPYDPQFDGPGSDTIVALQDQVGLTLKSQKMAADAVKVEHVERPSEN
jgi:uncharacterized protein (TIGR03435 family)